MNRGKILAHLLAGMALAAMLAGCESTNIDEINVPARLLYLKAETLENQGLFSEAIINYAKIIVTYPGIRLATYSYLKLAEIHSRQESWEDAEINYRLFLTLSGNSHLTPYLLYRLLKVNHEQSFTGVIFKEREVDRDMAPNRNIMLEYKRFFLLYPKSIYIEEVTPFFRAARQTLALHEELVADFYFDRELFNAAISRYLYLLKNFPEFKETDKVLDKLTAAYRENRQPDFAEEIERIRALRQEQGSTSAVDSGADGNLARTAVQ